MNNLPSNLNSFFAPAGALDTISGELRDSFAANNNAFALADLKAGAGALRYIKVGKTDFSLMEGGTELRTIHFNSLVGVLVGASDTTFGVWYQQKYQPGQEAKKTPDLVWKIWDDTKNLPDALPQEYRERDENGRWKFQQKKRLVFALLEQQPDGSFAIDFDHPCRMDITGMSIYTNAPRAAKLAQVNTYKWAGLENFCKRFSTGAVRLTPNMFFTQIVVDPEAPSGVVSFVPCCANGRPNILSQEMLIKVNDCMLAESTKQLAEVQEILDFHSDAESPAPAQPTRVVYQAPVIEEIPAAPVAQPAPMAQPQPAPVQNTMESLLAQADAALHGGAPAAQPAAAPAKDAADNNVQSLLDQLTF